MQRTVSTNCIKGQSLQQGPLSQYCAPSLGVDTINLAFVFQFGDSNPIFGNLGDCNITLSGPHPSPECQQVARDIEYCQSQETKILLSFGGGVGNYGLNNQSEAEAFATQVWELFGPVKNGYKGPRPLGDSVIDGVDLDIESSKGVFNYGFFVWRLRELFNTDLSKRYYITASPQCVVPDANMGDVIFNAPIDYLFVQYYNTRQCSARGHISGYLPVDGRNQYFTFPAWAEFTSTSFSQSAHAKIFIGLPASPTAAISNEDYFCTLFPPYTHPLIYARSLSLGGFCPRLRLTLNFRSPNTDILTIGF